ncbi:hypothetical protein SUGI_1002160 [Cryptomeria japonica]|nr:hypothetical protein SUGI_1002160 [Cryptomeria japonica]
MKISGKTAKSRNPHAKPQRFFPGSGRHPGRWKNSFAPLEVQFIDTCLENGLNAPIPEATGANLTSLKLNNISRRALGALSDRLPFSEAPLASSAKNARPYPMSRAGSPCINQKSTFAQNKHAPLFLSRERSTMGGPYKKSSLVLRPVTLSKFQGNMALEANRTTLGVRKPSSFNPVSVTRTGEEIFPKYGPSNFQKPLVFNTDNIMIISNNHTEELWDCYNTRGLFGKWFGYGVPSLEIQQWLKSLTGNQINDLMELFINEIIDEEELALQKSLLARELCTPFSEKLNEGKILLAVVMALSTDSWVGPFLRGGKHFMTPSEPAHRNTEKLQSLKLTCLVRLA